MTSRALQQLSQKVMDSDAHLFDVQTRNDLAQRYSAGSLLGWLEIVPWRESRAGNGDQLLPEVALPSGDVKITISDYTGKVVRNITGTKEVGLNRVQWNLRGDPPPRPATVVAVAVAAEAVVVAAVAVVSARL